MQVSDSNCSDFFDEELALAVIREQLSLCLTNTKFAAKFLFPEVFTAEFSPLHDEIFKAIDSGNAKIGIASPRGIGKTSIAHLIAKRAILFRSCHFIVYVSQSATVAEMQTENIKRSLLTSKTIRELFGNIRISDNDEDIGLGEEFSKKGWVAYGNTLILPRGAGQQVRGLNWNGFRPDLYIIDDLENKDELSNSDNRQKIKVWFRGDVEKSVNQYEKNYRFFYIDTVKHEDSNLQRILDSQSWFTIRQSICTDDMVSLAPNYLTTEEIRKEYEDHKRDGLLDVFYMELMNQVTGGEDATFRPEYFKYYDESDIVNNRDIETILLVDPAKTVKMHSAESAIVTVGIDRKSAKLYVRDIVADKLYPDQLYNMIFQQASRFGCKVLGIEVTSLNEFITQPLRNEMIKRGHFLGLIELNPRGGVDKEGRIAALAPYYRQGYVYHNQSCCLPLETQLLTYPRSKRKDVMDAFAYVVPMLDRGERWFDPPPIEDQPEAEYNDITNEPPLDNWRIC